MPTLSFLSGVFPGAIFASNLRIEFLSGRENTFAGRYVSDVDTKRRRMTCAKKASDGESEDFSAEVYCRVAYWV